jgi:hypothetical protein
MELMSEKLRIPFLAGGIVSSTAFTGALEFT